MSKVPLHLVVHVRGKVGGVPYFPPPISILRHVWTLPGPMPPTLTAETFYLMAFALFAISLTVAIIHCIVLISIPIPSIPQWSKIAGCGSLLWPLNCHPQLCNLSFQTHDVIFPLQMSQSHLDSLPRYVLLFRLSHTDCCHELRIHYPQVIIQIGHRIA